MSLLIKNVDLDSIQPKPAPFDRQAEIETLAHTIVELQGLLEIPVVRKLGFDDYELVAGDMEYHAFLKAREIDDQLPDRLTVFILETDNEKAIFKQLEANQAIQQANTSSSNSPQSDTALTLKVSNLESRSDQNAKQISAELAQFKAEMLSNLESRSEQNAKQVSAEIAQFKAEVLAAISTKSPPPLPSLSPLEAFNQINDPIVGEQVLRKLTIFWGKTKAKNIVAQLQAHRKNPENAEFQQPSDVRQALKSSTLGLKTLQEVIDQWNS